MEEHFTSIDRIRELARRHGRPTNQITPPEWMMVAWAKENHARGERRLSFMSLQKFGDTLCDPEKRNSLLSVGPEWLERSFKSLGSGKMFTLSETERG